MKNLLLFSLIIYNFNLFCAELRINIPEKKGVIAILNEQQEEDGSISRPQVLMSQEIYQYIGLIQDKLKMNPRLKNIKLNIFLDDYDQIYNFVKKISDSKKKQFFNHQIIDSLQKEISQLSTELQIRFMQISNYLKINLLTHAFAKLLAQKLYEIREDESKYYDLLNKYFNELFHSLKLISNEYSKLDIQNPNKMVEGIIEIIESHPKEAFELLFPKKIVKKEDKVKKLVTRKPIKSRKR